MRDDPEVAVQELAQAFELDAGRLGRSQQRQLADDGGACPGRAGGRRRVPSGKPRSERAVDPPVGQPFEAIGIATVVAFIERGVEGAHVEPIDGWLVVVRDKTEVG